MSSRVLCRLERLELRGCDWVTDTGVIAVAAAARASLQHLDLHSLDEVTTSAVLSALGACRRLERVDLGQTNVTMDAVKRLGVMLPFAGPSPVGRGLVPAARTVRCERWHHVRARVAAQASERIQTAARRWLCYTRFKERRARARAALCVLQVTARPLRPATMLQL